MPSLVYSCPVIVKVQVINDKVYDYKYNCSTVITANDLPDFNKEHSCFA